MEMMKLKGTVAALVVAAFASCGDDNGPADAPEPGTGSGVDLVSAEVPAAGWQGDWNEGVVTFVPGASGSERPYYAMSFSAGVCVGAVYEVVFADELDATAEAKRYAEGTWHPGYTEVDENGSPVVNNSLVLEVFRTGKVLYVPLVCFNGLSGSGVRDAIGFWEEPADSGAGTADVLFGELVEAGGLCTYTCGNAYGLDAYYELAMRFDDDGICTGYLTTVTATSGPWAELIRDSLSDEVGYVDSAFGGSVVQVSDHTVTIQAIIENPVDRTSVLAHLGVVDRAANRPYFSVLY